MKERITVTDGPPGPKDWVAFGDAVKYVARQVPRETGDDDRLVENRVRMRMYRAIEADVLVKNAGGMLRWSDVVVWARGIEDWSDAAWTAIQVVGDVQPLTPVTRELAVSDLIALHRHVVSLESRVAELEAENACLKAKLAARDLSNGQK